MSDMIHLEIGGVHILIKGEPDLIVEDVSQVYRPFIKGEKETPEDFDIRIFIDAGGMPDIDKLTKVFDGGLSWSLFHHKDDYYISLKPPNLNASLWIARFNNTFTEATIHCSEELLTKRNGRVTVSNPVCYPLDQILLMNHLAHKEGALVHAAGVAYQGRGYIFPGRSGAGKSALCGLFVSSEETTLLSDDRIVVRKIDDAFSAFGTPWPGDAGVAVNQSSPLAGIFFIYHGSENEIRPIEPMAAVEKLLTVVSVPWYDTLMMPRVLRFCEDLVTHVPTYELYFRPDKTVVHELEKFISV